MMLVIGYLLTILTIATNLFSTSFSSIIDEEAQKMKKTDNQKTHPKILEFNKDSQNRPTKCQGNSTKVLNELNTRGGG